jgi:hypothetical protein
MCTLGLFVGRNESKSCLEDASTATNNKLTSQSMANTTNTSVNCISPASSSSSHETGSSEEDDVIDTDDNLRV